MNSKLEKLRDVLIEAYRYVAIGLLAVFGGVALSACLCTVGNAATSEDRHSQTANVSDRKEESEKIGATGQQDGRDLFEPSHLMRNYAALGGDARAFFADWGEGQKKIFVRGFVETEERPPAGLIEIEGEGVFVVRRGDHISFQRGARTITLMIEEISNTSVRVKVMPLDETAGAGLSQSSTEGANKHGGERH